MTVLTREEIFKVLDDQHDALRHFGVKKLGVFGSFSRGDARPDSDLDFIVEFDRKSFDAYMDLKFYLQDLFHRDVDLVLSDRLKPRLMQDILQETRYAEGL